MAGQTPGSPQTVQRGTEQRATPTCRRGRQAHGDGKRAGPGGEHSVQSHTSNPVVLVNLRHPRKCNSNKSKKEDFSERLQKVPARSLVVNVYAHVLTGLFKSEPASPIAQAGKLRLRLGRRLAGAGRGGPLELLGASPAALGRTLSSPGCAPREGALRPPAMCPSPLGGPSQPLSATPPAPTASPMPCSSPMQPACAARPGHVVSGVTSVSQEWQPWHHPRRRDGPGVSHMCAGPCRHGPTVPRWEAPGCRFPETATVT